MGRSSSSIWKEHLGLATVSEYTPVAIPSNAPARVQEYIQHLEAGYFFRSRDTPESLEYMIQYYRTRTPWSRKAFRTTGVLIIVLGVLLPFVAGLGDRLELFGWKPDKDILVSALALVLGLLSGLNQFFRWDERWKGHTQSLFKLQRLRAHWELEKALACQMTDADKAIELLTSAVEELVTRAYDVAGEEMDNFFRLQRLPERSAPDSKS